MALPPQGGGIKRWWPLPERLSVCPMPEVENGRVLKAENWQETLPFST